MEVGRQTGESLVPAGLSPYLSPIRDSSERVVDTRLIGCRCLLCGMDPFCYPCPAHPAGWRVLNPIMARAWVATLSNHSPEPSPKHSRNGPRVVFLLRMRVVTIFGIHRMVKRRGRWVGEGLGECPVRVRFHDVSHQMTERTDLITSDRYDQLSRFGEKTESSGHLPSGLLEVKLTYNRVLCGENLPRRSTWISRANQTRTPDQIQFDSFASEPRSG